MFGTRRKRTEAQLIELEHKLELIYTALVVRDPGTARSAEAFEGLRKQVIAGATARHAHVAQLAEFDVALRRGANVHDLLNLTSQWLGQAGIERVDDPTRREAFESTLPPEVPVEVEIAAYVNTVTGQLVRPGRLRERELPAAESSREEVPVPEEADNVEVLDESNEAESPAADASLSAAEDAAEAAVAEVEAAATAEETK